jgi:hypothetical protein
MENLARNPEYWVLEIYHCYIGGNSKIFVNVRNKKKILQEYFQHYWQTLT